MRSRFPADRGRIAWITDDRGAVTAEFAVALPAVALVLAVVLGAIGLGAEQLRLQAATFDAARLLGRGGSGAIERIRSVAPDTTMSTRSDGPAICVDATTAASLGVFSGIRLRASACALNDAQP